MLRTAEESVWGPGLGRDGNALAFSQAWLRLAETADISFGGT